MNANEDPEFSKLYNVTFTRDGRTLTRPYAGDVQVGMRLENSEGGWPHPVVQITEIVKPRDEETPGEANAKIVAWMDQKRFEEEKAYEKPDRAEIEERLSQISDPAAKSAA